MGQFSKVLQLLKMHTQYHRGPRLWTRLMRVKPGYGPSHPTPSL